MNPNGPGDQINNKSGGDIIASMLMGVGIMFGIIWLFGWLFG